MNEHDSMSEAVLALGEIINQRGSDESAAIDDVIYAEFDQDGSAVGFYSSDRHGLMDAPDSKVPPNCVVITEEEWSSLLTRPQYYKWNYEKRSVEYRKPAFKIKDAILSKHNEIRLKYKEIKDIPFQGPNGVLWDGGRESVSMFQSEISLSESIGSLDVRMFDFDNVEHTLTIPFARSLMAGIHAQVTQLFRLKQFYMKAASDLTAEATQEDVDAILVLYKNTR